MANNAHGKSAPQLGLGVFPAGDAGLGSLSAEEFAGVTLRTEPPLVCVQTSPPLPSVCTQDKPPSVRLREEEKRGLCLYPVKPLKSIRPVSPCASIRFNDKSMVITEPAVLSAWLLCLESKLQQATHVQQRSYLTDSCTVFLEYAKIA